MNKWTQSWIVCIVGVLLLGWLGLIIAGLIVHYGIKPPEDQKQLTNLMIVCTVLAIIGTAVTRALLH